MLESARAAQISPVSQEITANAFNIHRRVVREIMTPRREVVLLDIGLSFQDNLQRLSRSTAAEVESLTALVQG